MGAGHAFIPCTMDPEGPEILLSPKGAAITVALRLSNERESKDESHDDEKVETREARSLSAPTSSDQKVGVKVETLTREARSLTVSEMPPTPHLTHAAAKVQPPSIT